MDAIVVIVDRFTKMIQLKAMNISSEGKIHNVLRKILSNRELQFMSRFMKELMEALGTKRMLSMIYHSQTDGQTERINQEIEMFL